jgi:hypothetical protein
MVSVHPSLQSETGAALLAQGCFSITRYERLQRLLVPVGRSPHYHALFLKVEWSIETLGLELTIVSRKRVLSWKRTRLCAR